MPCYPPSHDSVTQQPLLWTQSTITHRPIKQMRMREFSCDPNVYYQISSVCCIFKLINIFELFSLLSVSQKYLECIVFCTGTLRNAAWFRIPIFALIEKKVHTAWSVCAVHWQSTASLKQREFSWKNVITVFFFYDISSEKTFFRGFNMVAVQ